MSKNLLILYPHESEHGYVYPLKSKTPSSMGKEITEILEGFDIYGWNDSYYNMIKSGKIVKVSRETSIDIEAHVSSRQERVDAKKEAEDRAEYEKLKARFEK